MPYMLVRHNVVDYENWKPVFEEQLVLVTSKATPNVAGPADLGRSTLIAFTQGCSYRKRVEEWLGSANVMPERVLEFASYQAMIACVAAGTGFGTAIHHLRWMA